MDTVSMRATTRLIWSVLLSGIFSLSIAGLMTEPVVAQVQGGQAKPLPRQEYYLVFNDFYNGRYEAAGKRWSSFSRSAFVDAGGRFFDSICYWTMMGEAHYQLGEYGLALEQYNAALDLYAGTQLQAWTTRTTFPATIVDNQGAATRARVPWATSTRSPVYGKFDNTMLMQLGKTDAENEQALRNGGVIDPLRWRSVDIAEVVRCVCLALHRRQTILGPTAVHDPFSKQLTSNLIGNGGATIPAAWTGVAKGLAYISQGDHSRAAQLLRGSLHIAGRDHPMTPVALLGLGKIAMAAGQADGAQQLFLEASICAAAFEQFDVVNESLRFAALIHAAGGTMTPYQPLVDAIGWARSENRDPLQASLLITAAMVAAEAGDTTAAGGLLKQARGEMSRNDLRDTILQPQWLYVDAMIHYIEENTRNGDKQFSEFQKYSRRKSLWLFQIAMADNAVREGLVTERAAELLYDALLHEPTDLDWKFRPVETMTYLTTPHYEPMERWFEITLGRKAEEKAIGIAELIRRQRYFSTLPFGGRLLSLRWVLEAPDEALSKNAALQKESLLARYPAYKEVSDGATALRLQLEDLLIVPDKESEDRLKQDRLMQEYAVAVDQQEKFLRKIALTREPCELTFPQPLTVVEVQQRLKPGQVIVSFLKIGRQYYVMKLSGGRYTIESTIQAKVLDRKILQLMKQINVSDKASILDVDLFATEEWRQTARDISALIFAKTEPQALDSMEEIVFVPDAKAWYLPMELLQYGSAESSVNISDKVRVRYAPMVNLAVPDLRKTRRFRRRGLVAERNFIRDDAERIANGVTDIQSVIPDLETIDKTFRGPSGLLASTLDQLIVWHLSSEKSGGPFDFSPLQLDQGRPGAGLDSWLMLPLRGVDQMILAGVSSGIEGSNRGRADGSELFLSTTSMMASGSRTVLISRWRVGGQSTLDLTRELALGLGKQSASKAWQRSVELLHESEVDISAEPRLRDKVLDQPMKADHPFFWAGYMLLDTGNEPARELAGNSGGEAGDAVNDGTDSGNN